MKYVLGLTTGGILQALQLSDPDTPRLVRTPDSNPSGARRTSTTSTCGVACGRMRSTA